MCVTAMQSHMESFACQLSWSVRFYLQVQIDAKGLVPSAFLTCCVGCAILLWDWIPSVGGLLALASCSPGGGNCSIWLCETASTTAKPLLFIDPEIQFYDRSAGFAYSVLGNNSVSYLLVNEDLAYVLTTVSLLAPYAISYQLLDLTSQNSKLIAFALV